MNYSFLELFFITLFIYFLSIFVSIILRRYKIIKIKNNNIGCFLNFFVSVFFTLFLTIIQLIYLYFKKEFYEIDLNYIIFIFLITISLEFVGAKELIINYLTKIFKKIKEYIEKNPSQIYFDLYKFQNYNLDIPSKIIFFIHYLILLFIECFNLLPIIINYYSYNKSIIFLIFIFPTLSIIFIFFNNFLKSFLLYLLLVIILPLSRTFIFYILISLEDSELVNFILLIYAIFLIVFWLIPYFMSNKLREKIIYLLTKGFSYSIKLIIIFFLASPIAYYFKLLNDINIVISLLMPIFGIYLFLFFSIKSSIKYYEIKNIGEINE